MNQKELPQVIELEKQVISAMFMKEVRVVPNVAAIIDASELRRCFHKRLSKE